MPEVAIWEQTYCKLYINIDTNATNRTTTQFNYETKLTKNDKNMKYSKKEKT